MFCLVNTFLDIDACPLGMHIDASLGTNMLSWLHSDCDSWFLFCQFFIEIFFLMIFEKVRIMTISIPRYQMFTSYML